MHDEPSLEPLLEYETNQDIEVCRCVPVTDTTDSVTRILLVYSADHFDPANDLAVDDIDSITLALVTGDGDAEWTLDLGPGTLPGTWFCPVFPFDIDEDGRDEIFLVDTEDDEWHTDPDDPGFPMTGEQLVQLDSRTGQRDRTIEWPWRPSGPVATAYRYFIMGAQVGDEPLLLTAQGTYMGPGDGGMKIQAWNPDLERVWTHHIENDGHGPWGCHRTPILDLDDDGDDELLWGERLLDLSDGSVIWCADWDWDGHSDYIIPTRTSSGEWYIFTARETWHDQSPRVVTYDKSGEPMWSAVDHGHMHWGWTAWSESGRIAMAGQPEGDDFPGHCDVWEAESGTPREVGFDPSRTLPVDVDGDGQHEILHRGTPETEESPGLVQTQDGEDVGQVDPHVTYVQPSKLLDHPGEQIPCYTADGTIRIWGDTSARDTRRANQRYEQPYYEKARALSAVGYNWELIAGI